MVNVLSTILAGTILGGAVQATEEPVFTDSFNLGSCKLKIIMKNSCFLLQPGYQLLYVGEAEVEGESLVLLIIVLRKTSIMDGARCRIVWEMEWADGELVEYGFKGEPDIPEEEDD
jgi:hypothetical protein